MSDASYKRLGTIWLSIGSLLFILGALLHPAVDPPLQVAGGIIFGGMFLTLTGFLMRFLSD